LTLSSDEKKALVQVRLQAAAESIDDAKRLCAAESWRGAMNRAYYGMFHAANALALAHGAVCSKHTHLIAFFQKEFAKPEILDRRHGRSFQKAFEDRSEADYQDYITFDEAQVATRIQEAEDFLQAIRDHLRKS
jgi:uncharacterized protein (UPF0332 family)